MQRWAGADALRWPLPACVDPGHSVDQHAFAGNVRGLQSAVTDSLAGIGTFEGVPKVFVRH